MEEYKDAPMVNPNKIYPPLPLAQNITPLVRVPEQMTFTERIGGTEYSVTAHFRKEGQDLLGMLSDIFVRNARGYGFYDDGEDGNGDWDNDEEE